MIIIHGMNSNGSPSAGPTGGIANESADSQSPTDAPLGPSGLRWLRASFSNETLTKAQDPARWKALVRIKASGNIASGSRLADFRIKWPQRRDGRVVDGG